MKPFKSSTFPIAQVAVMDWAKDRAQFAPVELCEAFGMKYHRAAKIVRHMHMAGRLHRVKYGVYRSVE